LRPQFVRFEESELTIDERTAAVEVNEVLVGIVGEVHPKHLKYLELKAPVAVFEISVNKLAEVLGVRVF
ncbi:MAG: hypothetical protein QXP10_01430, partial [Sulfolobales archaeon]